MDIVDKDTPLAIENYILSTKYSIDNDIQKSVSFLQLGKIYYNRSDYISSKTFYDKVYTFISEEHSQFEETENTQKILEKLVNHLSTISLEDSLQMLSSLPESERRKIIQSVAAEIVKKEQDELREKQNRGYRGMLDRGGEECEFWKKYLGGKVVFLQPCNPKFWTVRIQKKMGKT